MRYLLIAPVLLAGCGGTFEEWNCDAPTHEPDARAAPDVVVAAHARASFCAALAQVPLAATAAMVGVRLVTQPPPLPPADKTVQLP